MDATDIHKHKIGLIKENIVKLQLNNIKAFDHDATKPYKDVYDKILVDAPCSGLGVLDISQKLNMFKRNKIFKT